MKAKFLGWQEFGRGFPPMCLFNIIGGRLDGSTVSAETLLLHNIEVPAMPTFEQWQRWIAGEGKNWGIVCEVNKQ